MALMRIKLVKLTGVSKGDQSALRALRDVYKANGVLYDGGLNEQIYEPEMAYESLHQFAYASMIDEGSLNLCICHQQSCFIRRN